MAIFNGKIHYKWQFSIATLNYQRVAAHSCSRLGSFMIFWLLPWGGCCFMASLRGWQRNSCWVYKRSPGTSWTTIHAALYPRLGRCLGLATISIHIQLQDMRNTAATWGNTCPTGPTLPRFLHLQIQLFRGIALPSQGWNIQLGNHLAVEHLDCFGHTSWLTPAIAPWFDMVWWPRKIQLKPDPCWKSQSQHHPTSIHCLTKKQRIPAARKLLAIISQLLWKTPGNLRQLMAADPWHGMENPMLETWHTRTHARTHTHTRTYIFMYTHVLYVFWFYWHICLYIYIYYIYIIIHYTNRKSVWMYYVLLILQILQQNLWQTLGLCPVASDTPSAYVSLGLQGAPNPAWTPPRISWRFGGVCGLESLKSLGSTRFANGNGGNRFWMNSDELRWI